MKRLLLSVALLILMLCGCSGPEKGKEPENTVLVQVLGIDWTGVDYMLTAAGTNGQGNSRIQSVQGRTLAEVFGALPKAGGEWFSLTNVTQFLLGDGVDPVEVLTFILNESGMSWRGSVWYVPIAGAVMTEQEDGGMDRLKILQQTEPGVISALEALAGLRMEGTAKLPSLMVRDGVLEVSGAVYYETSLT